MNQQYDYISTFFLCMKIVTSICMRIGIVCFLHTSNAFWTNCFMLETFYGFSSTSVFFHEGFCFIIVFIVRCVQGWKSIQIQQLHLIRLFISSLNQLLIFIYILLIIHFCKLNLKTFTINPNLGQAKLKINMKDDFSKQTIIKS